MKRCLDSSDTYRALSADVQRTGGKLKRLDLNENELKSTPGTVIGADEFNYLVQTIDGSTVKAAKATLAQDFELEDGDHVEILHSVKPNLSNLEIVVKELNADVFEDRVGLVTNIQDYGVIVGDTILPPVSPDEAEKLMGAAVDYTAVRNSHRNPCYKYRGISMQVITDPDRLNKVVPDFKTTMEQFEVSGTNAGGIVVGKKMLLYKFVESAGMDQVQCQEIQVQNIALQPNALLNCAIKTHTTYRDALCKVVEPDLSMGPVSIPGHGSITIQVEASPQTAGIITEQLELTFENCTIGCSLYIATGSHDFLAKYQPHATPLLKRPPSNRQVLRNYHAVYTGPVYHNAGQIGSRTQATNKFTLKMGEWKVPPEISTCLGKSPEQWENILAQFDYLPSPLTPFNYVEKWHFLLWFDEMVLFRLLQRYCMNNVILTPEEQSPNEFSLPGHYSEQRPSVIPGDRFQCFALNGRRKFDGLVVRVLVDKAIILMNADFQRFAHLPVDTTFKLSRTLYRVMHDVVAKREPQIENDRFLFPTRENLDRQSPQLDIRLSGGVLWLDSDQPLQTLRSDLNKSQLSTLKNIGRGEYRSHPYLISGPPGTGKTTVLVEIIYMLLRHLEKPRILLCTQSNSAANLIVQKLANVENILHFDKVLPKDMLRVIGTQVYKDYERQVPENIWDYCAALAEDDDESPTEPKANFIRPHVDMSTLCNTPILVTTCATVAYIRRMAFPTEHLTHLILDEAGHCLEPETLIPLSLMENSNAQLVMAGDVKQLGPVVQWEKLANCGYNVSLFERLLNIPGLYTEDPNWMKQNKDKYPVVPDLYSELVLNYRSGPHILSLYNDFFYDGKLRSARINEAVRDALVRHLLTGLFPTCHDRSTDQSVFFMSVIGENMRTQDSPSWYNSREAEVVLELYLKIQAKNINVANDVAIISPYQGQINYIRSLLAQRGLRKCRLGTVEEFQGQECAIVILSTVRSTTDLLEMDQTHNLGFTTNPRRTNVALSRAQCILIIVGNAFVLHKDPLWKKIVERCAYQYGFVDYHAQDHNK